MHVHKLLVGAGAGVHEAAVGVAARLEVRLVLQFRKLVLHGLRAPPEARHVRVNAVAVAGPCDWSGVRLQGPQRPQDVGAQAAELRRDQVGADGRIANAVLAVSALLDRVLALTLARQVVLPQRPLLQPTALLAYRPGPFLAPGLKLSGNHRPPRRLVGLLRSLFCRLRRQCRAELVPQAPCVAGVVRLSSREVSLSGGRLEACPRLQQLVPGCGLLPGGDCPGGPGWACQRLLKGRALSGRQATQGLLLSAQGARDVLAALWLGGRCGQLVRRAEEAARGAFTPSQSPREAKTQGLPASWLKQFSFGRVCLAAGVLPGRRRELLPAQAPARGRLFLLRLDSGQRLPQDGRGVAGLCLAGFVLGRLEDRGQLRQERFDLLCRRLGLRRVAGLGN